MECGDCRRTRVLDIDDRYAFDPERSQCDFAAHHVLPFHMALDTVTEKCRSYRFFVAAGVCKDTGERFAGERFKALVQVLPEVGHANAGNVNVAHFAYSESLGYRFELRPDGLLGSATEDGGPVPVKWYCD